MPRRTTPKPIALQFGVRLRKLRLERGLNLAQLAEASALAKGHLSDMERGLVVVGVRTLVSLAYGLNMPLSRLVTFAEDGPYAEAAELVYRLPAGHVRKLRRELRKAVEARKSTA